MPRAMPANAAAGVLRKSPTTGISCCACTESGHAAAAPPTRVMNSRRLN
jgi:hypothetical protein